MRIAFHTPLNRFEDGGVSGDRRMARQLVAVLRALGHHVEPVIAPRAYLRSSDTAELAAHQAGADALSRDLVARWREDAAQKPDLWFTYHNYYRAPDLLGQAITDTLDIPYVTAEASDTARRAQGEWAAHTAIVRAGLGAGDVHFYFTERDRAGLEPWRKPGTALLPLPPFIAFDRPPPARAGTNDPLRLVTIAMMREGTKQNSYLALARILDRIRNERWRLAIIGDGSQRPAIEQAFATLPTGRVTFRGLLDREAAMQELAASDLFVWPGIREAYGLVYLEAQAAGLPVVAFDSGGVPDIVAPNESAILVEEGDEAGFAATLADLLGEADRRRRMSLAARNFALTERSPEQAARRLAEGLSVAIRNRRAKRAARMGAGRP